MFSPDLRVKEKKPRPVYTSFFEPGLAPPKDESEAAVVTVTFEAEGNKTRLVARERYPSKEVLDGAMATGMEVGMRETMDLLDELVETLR